MSRRTDRTKNPRLRVLMQEFLRLSGRNPNGLTYAQLRAATLVVMPVEVLPPVPPKGRTLRRLVVACMPLRAPPLPLPALDTPSVAPPVAPKRTPKAVTSFYQSDEWRELRYRALKLHGACCQCCGGRGAPGKPLHVDHIKPRSKHPELELDLNNLQVLCMDCNLGKRAWDETDWRRRRPPMSELLKAEKDLTQTGTDDTYTKYQAARQRFVRTCAQ